MVKEAINFLINLLIRDILSRISSKDKVRLYFLRGSIKVSLIKEDFRVWVNLHGKMVLFMRENT
jgi:hypothetical protein